MKLEVNVSKKYAFMILAAVLIVGGVLGVIAYNSGLDPDVMGHTIDEIYGIVNIQTYDSGWFSARSGNTYTSGQSSGFSALGFSDPDFIEVWASQNGDDNEKRCITGDATTDDGVSTGVQIQYDITTKEIVLKTNRLCAQSPLVSGDGFLRVKAIKF